MTSPVSTSTSQFFVVFVIFSIQMVFSAPLLSATSEKMNDNHEKKFIPFPSFDYLAEAAEGSEEMEMLKRDFEEPIFLDPSEGNQFRAVFYLPRTDRKQQNLLFPSNYFDANTQMFEGNQFENLQINLRSNIPIQNTVAEEEERQSPPPQKELLGPIVVGPQTKSTQTNSAKKN